MKTSLTKFYSKFPKELMLWNIFSITAWLYMPILINHSINSSASISIVILPVSSINVWSQSLKFVRKRVYGAKDCWWYWILVPYQFTPILFSKHYYMKITLRWTVYGSMVVASCKKWCEIHKKRASAKRGRGKEGHVKGTPDPPFPPCVLHGCRTVADYWRSDERIDKRKKKRKDRPARMRALASACAHLLERF